jgi:hypothetical protein
MWCRLSDSNRRPTAYKAVALPTELKRRACNDTEKHHDFLRLLQTVALAGHPVQSNSRGVKSALVAPHSGQTQSSGISSHLVPGGMPSSGSPSRSS